MVRIHLPPAVSLQTIGSAVEDLRIPRTIPWIMVGRRRARRALTELVTAIVAGGQTFRYTFRQPGSLGSA